MRKYLLVIFLSVAAISLMPSCNTNKIACPTYKDSFGDQSSSKKTKPGKQEPQMPKATKPISGVLPPGYGKKK